MATMAGRSNPSAAPGQTPRIPTRHDVRAHEFQRSTTPDVQRQAPGSGSGQAGYYYASAGIPSHDPQGRNGLGPALAASKPMIASGGSMEVVDPAEARQAVTPNP